jgi:hypothetical protein
MRKVTTRILMLYFAGVIIFFALRVVLVPPTFGEIGWYRAESVGEIAGLQTKIGEEFRCFDCHITEYAEWSVGEHRNVSCESCHGLLKLHAENPEKYKGYDEFLSPEAFNSTIDFCLSCHGESISKPEHFPQISVKHSKSWDCLNCHNPHNPVGS